MRHSHHNAVRYLETDLLDQFAHVQFLKVDVDKVQAIAQKYRVSAMPTFIVIKGGKVVGEVSSDLVPSEERLADIRMPRHQMKGANPAGLSTMVSQHAGPVPAPSASGSGASTAPAEPGVVCI